jgi:hypothetical protein
MPMSPDGPQFIHKVAENLAQENGLRAAADYVLASSNMEVQLIQDQDDGGNLSEKESISEILQKGRVIVIANSGHPLSWALVASVLPDREQVHSVLLESSMIKLNSPYLHRIPEPPTDILGNLRRRTRRTMDESEAALKDGDLLITFPVDGDGKFRAGIEPIIRKLMSDGYENDTYIVFADVATLQPKHKHSVTLSQPKTIHEVVASIPQGETLT